MQQPPMSQILAWPTPNYTNPTEIRGNENLILNIVLYSILLCCIGLRIFTRTKLMRVFGADDIFILCAMIPTTAFFILSILAHTKFLWKRHVYDIPYENVTTGLKLVLSTEVMFGAACTLTKLSMLMLVRRMLANSSVFWRRLTAIAITIVSVQGTVFCLTVVFQCRPPQDYWKITIDPQPNCINQGNSLLVAGIINTITDFICVMLPIRTVWHLQLKARQTFIVITLFALGFSSCIAGVVRTYYTYRVLLTWDSTWASFPVWVSSGIELYIGIICASIPATKPFFTTYLPYVFGSITASELTDRSYAPYGSRPAPYSENQPRPNTDEAEILHLEKSLKMGGSKLGPVMHTSTVTSGTDDASIEADLETVSSHQDGRLTPGITITHTVNQLSSKY